MTKKCGFCEAPEGEVVRYGKRQCFSWQGGLIGQPENDYFTRSIVVMLQHRTIVDVKGQQREVDLCRRCSEGYDRKDTAKQRSAVNGKRKEEKQLNAGQLPLWEGK